MKKIFLLCFLFSFLFGSNIKELNNINELEENRVIFLMFSTSYCPWCIRQTNTLEKIQEKRKNLQIFNVKDESKIYKELLAKYPFVIEFYPTSYLVSKENGELEINYEFQGYQKEENILKVLDNENNY